MNFEGKIEIAAPGKRAWDFLLDVDEFSSCMPGLEKITKIDDRTFDGVISASVGPISGKFTFRATILESKPPEEMQVRAEGKDSVTGSNLSAGIAIRLREPVASHTELSYHANVEIKGRLAILGDMIVRATALLLVEEFARRVRSKLEGASV
ncbi:MAG: hypothetical protein HY695_18985 [Deltaproteobacteria bacterium]|nr:hypothetical protein [Deltaproteobacteria bacterium]